MSTKQIRLGEIAKYLELNYFRSTEVVGGSFMLVTGVLGTVAAALAIASAENTLSAMESNLVPELVPRAQEAKDELRYGEGLCFGALIAAVVVIILGISLLCMATPPLRNKWGRTSGATNPLEFAKISQRRTKIIESSITAFIVLAALALALAVTGPVGLQWGGIASIYESTKVGDFQLAPDYSVQLYSASYGIMLSTLFFGVLVMGAALAVGMGNGVGIMNRFSSKALMEEELPDGGEESEESGPYSRGRASAREQWF